MHEEPWNSIRGVTNSSEPNIIVFYHTSQFIYDIWQLKYISGVEKLQNVYNIVFHLGLLI